MNQAASVRTVLIVAGGLSVGMGGFHWWLPEVFGWNAGMAAAPASLRWALPALNAFWSLLAVATGAIAWRLARGEAWRTPAGRFVATTLAAYWLLHTVYLVTKPFPLPSRLAWLGWGFVGFATAQALLHAWAAIARLAALKHLRLRRQQTTTDT